LRALVCAALVAGGQGVAWAQTKSPGPELPEPTPDPLRIDFGRDPILMLSERTAPVEEFRQAVASAVERHPARLEAVAVDDEARAALSEARERLYPSGNVTLTSYKVLAREFSDDPDNIIERSRPERRTDFLVSFQQTVFDFGATSQRIAAARARLASTAAEVEYASDRLALNTIANWYDVFAYRALTAVALQFTGMQEEFRAAIRERVDQGVSAETDIARVESYIAAANSRLAQLRRAAAQAEARYAELTGMAPLSPLPRAPQLGDVARSSSMCRPPSAHRARRRRPARRAPGSRRSASSSSPAGPG
jgi:adhesin transport system outer membrane protein